MLKQVMDFVIGLVAKMFFGEHRPSTSSMFDLDAFFERIAKIGDSLVERLQKMMVALMMLAGLAVLAVSVLTVRIFQLSAERTVRVFGLFDMDGALFFGVVLTMLAIGIGAWIVKTGRAPIDAQPAQLRPLYHEAPPTRSPLEDALAALIQSHVEERRRRPANAEPGAAWNTPPMSPATGLPDDDAHRPHDA